MSPTKPHEVMEGFFRVAGCRVCVAKIKDVMLGFIHSAMLTLRVWFPTLGYPKVRQPGANIRGRMRAAVVILGCATLLLCCPLPAMNCLTSAMSLHHATSI